MTPQADEKPSLNYFVSVLDMKLYTPGDFREILANAGFTGIEILTAKNNAFICVTAKKPGPAPQERR
jgi:hypothetical protein